MASFGAMLSIHRAARRHLGGAAAVPRPLGRTTRSARQTVPRHISVHTRSHHFRGPRNWLSVSRCVRTPSAHHGACAKARANRADRPRHASALQMFRRRDDDDSASCALMVAPAWTARPPCSCHTSTRASELRGNGRTEALRDRAVAEQDDPVKTEPVPISASGAQPKSLRPGTVAPARMLSVPQPWLKLLKSVPSDRSVASLGLSASTKLRARSLRKFLGSDLWFGS